MSHSGAYTAGVKNILVPYLELELIPQWSYHMYSATQRSQLGWPAAYPGLPNPYHGTNTVPVTLTDPHEAAFVAVLESSYVSHDTYYNMAFHDRHHDADSPLSQEYLQIAGTTDADQSTTLNLCQPDSLPMSDNENATVQTAHIWDGQPFFLHHQTLMDFKKDMLRNTNADANENEYTFRDWAYPRTEGLPAQSSVKNTGNNSILHVKLRGTQPRVGVRHKTQFRRQLLPESSKSEEGDEEEDEEEDEDDSDTDDPFKYNQAQGPEFSVGKKAGTDMHQPPPNMQTDSSTASGAGSLITRQEPKKYRKKLTMEQKRSNHIRYEKRRRGLIRDRFLELTELVPELRGGTWSRSRILLKAVEWLQELLDRNEALQEQLDEMRNYEGNETKQLL